MRKKLLPMVVIFLNTLVYAQVGINTTTPQSTMDIVAKNSNGTSTLADGLLIPRVDRERAVNMASVQPSTLIYVNNITSGSAIGQGSNIDTIGFYYFDGITNKWSKLATSTSTGDPTPDSFIDDNTNTMVKLGATSSGAARVAGSDFVIKDNGQVGVGTSIPLQKLDVRGSGRFESDNVSLDMISAGTAAANMNLTRNNGGANLSSDNLIGYVDFKGRINNTDNSTLSAIVSTYKGDGTNNLSSLDFRTSGNELSDMLLDSSGNLGIGTAFPSEKLDVTGNVSLKPGSSGLASSAKFYESTANGTNTVSLQAPANLSANRTITLPSNPPVNGYVLTTSSTGVTQWGAVNPAAATLASISLSNESLGSTSITNGGTNNTTVNQRFFQKFDTTVTDPNSRFNVGTGTYTVAQSGIYLISAYIMPNSSPDRNTNGFFYPVNLEVRKNAFGDPSGGSNIMDNTSIRYATPLQAKIRYSVLVTGMVSLNAGDTLNLVVYLNGINAPATASAGGYSFPTEFTYATISDFKALFSVTAL